MKDLYHYTVDSGDLRKSPRSEVAQEIIELLQPLLVDGVHAIPNYPEFTVRVTVDGNSLAATVFRGARPYVTFVTVLDELGMVIARQVLGVNPGVRLGFPACIVKLQPTLDSIEALFWLGDFERCLAWAWVERKRPGN